LSFGTAPPVPPPTPSAPWQREHAVENSERPASSGSRACARTMSWAGPPRAGPGRHHAVLREDGAGLAGLEQALDRLVDGGGQTGIAPAARRRRWETSGPRR
jgi:hypothetical protein